MSRFYARLFRKERSGTKLFSFQLKGNGPSGPVIGGGGMAPLAIIPSEAPLFILEPMISPPSVPECRNR